MANQTHVAVAQLRQGRSCQGMTLLVAALLAVLVVVGTGVGVYAVVQRLVTHTKLCIATDFPTTGTAGGSGLPAQNGANLAILQHQNLGNGYTLQVINYNDVSAARGVADPHQGVQNVQEMVHTSCIVGMVGPFDSKVAAAEMPMTAQAGLVMISPSNTNPGLTLRPYAAASGFHFALLHPPGKKINYFRITANDVAQGRVEAKLTKMLGAQRVYVVDDQEWYGVGLATFFIQAFQASGGLILGHDEIPPVGTAGLIPKLAQKIAATHPDAVFYGGVTPTGGGVLKAQLVAQGFNGPMVGGDGIAEDPSFVKQAGSAANGTYGTRASLDPSVFTSGARAQFVSNYRAAFSGQHPGSYSSNAYDAAMVIIQAIKSLSVAGRQVTRDALIDAVQGMHYDGLLGHISFDSNGDNSGDNVFSVYEIQSGRWVYLQQISG